MTELMSSHSAVRSFCREIRQRRIPEEAAVDEIHDEERRADDCCVVAVAVGARDRDVGVAERRHDAILAIDGMRRRQELPSRLLAQHVIRAAEAKAKRRIRLPPGEGLDARLPRAPGKCSRT